MFGQMSGCGQIIFEGFFGGMRECKNSGRQCIYVGETSLADIGHWNNGMDILAETYY